jgi:integrase
MKANRDHRVPLSAPAMAVLKRMADVRTGDFVFPGSGKSGHLSNMAMLTLIGRMGMKGQITTHGFRSTLKDWAAETTNFSGEVSEMTLAHAVGDKVEAAYRRGDMFQKRVALMGQWARYCGQSAHAASVIPLRRKSKA